MHHAEQVWAKRAEKRGETNERQKIIGTTIDICRRLGASQEAIIIQLMSGFKLSRDEAVSFVNQKFA